MTATTPQTFPPIVRVLAAESAPLAGRDLEFHTPERKYLGKIKDTQPLLRAQKLHGVTIFMEWMKEAEPNAPNWAHARSSHRSQLFLTADDLTGLVHTDDDDIDRLTLPNGETVIIMPEGDNVDPAEVCGHGY